MKKTLKNIVAISLVVPSMLVMTGCARNIGASNYTGASVGEAMTSYPGVIVSKRQIEVQEGDKLSDNQAGILAGGVGGAVLGSQIGQGSGSVLAAVGGAALGATAGAFAERELSKQSAFEYTIKLDNGTLKTVTQGMDVDLQTGQRVILHISNQGRSRVVPYQG